MNQPRWLDADEMRAWKAFLAATALVNRQVDHQLKEEMGLSHLQYEILVRLNQAPEAELRMTVLADALLNSKSGLTYQINQLEKAGLVRRRTCPTDVRSIYACLTDAGRTMLQRAAPGHVTAVRQLFIDLLTPSQLAELADSLEKVAVGYHQQRE
ncbi:MarR family transcriptional regulator [Nocardia sp. SYP-A9097]|uniref:MarR family winged helix-turn-helix transcriptional regulator n=1 Tax=Nocardia sp. SYP-A9097 TaxID=2663237 RepID=UPI00129C07B2|nr:MarR family transcriptional regulator [Nocardia sp. SYP-A9097]MRH91219.1 MarR family transcriptional regulator [Nocardia sp. SYP-A9097]